MKRKSKYTVAEFAKILDVSTTAIYKRLKADLKQYLVVENGKKYILDTYFEESEVSNKFEIVSNEVSNKFEISSEQKEKEAGITVVLSALSAELEKKDEVINSLQTQIETLLAEMSKKDDFIMEQTKQLSMLLENSQKLQAMTQKTLLVAENPQEERNAPKEEEHAQKEKKNIFKKLFGK
jgi:hypothetical protein